MKRRTDLALEQLRSLGGQSSVSGVKITEQIYGLATLSLVEIENEEASHQLGKPCGRYYTVDGRPFAQSVDDNLDQIKAAARALQTLLPKSGLVGVVGLGNRLITPDALGPLVADQVIATRHLEPHERTITRLRPTMAIAPGVLPQTGLEAGELASWLTSSLRPSAVIAVDALAAGDSDRLGRTIQISDVGIVPGSGVQGNHKALCKQSLGVPVIAVGVPTVVDADRFVSEYLHRVGVEQSVIDAREKLPLMVTPHQIDLIIRRSSYSLAFAINLALQPSLSSTEIQALMS